MKLVTFQANGEQRLGAWVGGNVFDLNACYSLYLTGVTREKVREISPEALLKMEEKTSKEMPTCMMSFLQLGDQGLLRVKKVLERVAEFCITDMPKCTVHKIDDVVLKSPIPRPGKILCLAGNYAEHIREAGRDVVDKTKMAPRIFVKPGTSIAGFGDAIVIPKKGNKIDWEAELVVVIGKEGKYIPKEKAYDYVAGYTIMNDISERELIIDSEREPSEWNKFFDWLNGKWMDTFGPMGPCIVTKEDIENPHDLKLVLKLNGKIKQDSNTGNMIFDIPAMIERWSWVTLEPGDIIATGTPAGAAVGGKDPYLQAGDVMECIVERLGTLQNPVVAEKE